MVRKMIPFYRFVLCSLTSPAYLRTAESQDPMFIAADAWDVECTEAEGFLTKDSLTFSLGLGPVLMMAFA